MSAARVVLTAARPTATMRATKTTAAAAAAAAASSSGAGAPVPFARVPAPWSASGASASDAATPTPTPAPRVVKVALCQLACPTADKVANIARAREAIRNAAEGGAALVVLPEMWNCPYANESFPAHAETIGASIADWPSGADRATTEKSNDPTPSVTMLSEAAAAHDIVLVGGSIPERGVGVGGGGGADEEDVLYNACCVFDGKRGLIARHRKTHLFDVDIPGEISFRESDTLTEGEGLTVVDTAVGRVGVGICFDVRFGEMAAAMANRGADVLIYPGAFNTVTGPHHWELLQRARAVDNQCFVLTCSPARNTTGEGYQAWGHSTAVGPFAEVLATTDERPGIVFAELDLGEVTRRRRNMPLATQRRGDLYALHDLGAVRGDA